MRCWCWRLVNDGIGENFGGRGMEVKGAFGGYDVDVPASDDRLALVVYSEKKMLTNDV